MATTFFVSGHMDITHDEFETHYAQRVRKAYASGARFVVGDAPGCDEMAQALLCGLDRNSCRSSCSATVYHMFALPRRNVGVFPLIGGFSSDEERDAAMTGASDDDIAWVRPVKAKRRSGTAKNIERRAVQRKAARAAEMHIWPVFNVNTHEIADDGERYVSVSSAGQGHGVDVHLPQELVDRLRDARRAVAEAKGAENRIEEEIRLVVAEQEGG